MRTPSFLRVDWSSLIESGQDLFFPARCLGCGQRLCPRRLPLLCPACHQRLPFITAPLCSCCGRPFRSGSGQNHLCGQCLTASFAFDRARSLALYQEPLLSLLHGLKFQGKLTMLATFGALTASSAVERDLTPPDLIVPVPLHPQRLRSRGFNQALLLAHSCFPAWRPRIHPHLLRRIRPTPPQTSLSGAKRRRNLHGAFQLAAPAAVVNKRILLIDDVFTTGSTVNECAKILRHGGAARVEVFALLRV